MKFDMDKILLLPTASKKDFKARDSETGSHNVAPHIALSFGGDLRWSEKGPYPLSEKLTESSGVDYCKLDNTV